MQFVALSHLGMYVFLFMGACVPGCTCGDQRTTCQEESVFISPLPKTGSLLFLCLCCVF